MVSKTKYCPKCDTTKSVKDFHGRGRYFMGYCKPCQCSYVNEARTLLRAKMKAIIQEAKHNKPCTDCGGRHPYWAMDFDHLDPSIKKFEIGRASSKCFTEVALRAELAKCELVCALCHRYRTNGMQRSKPARSSIG